MLLRNGAHMNGKQAKRLRRVAMGFATTMDQAGRRIDAHGYELQEHREVSVSSIMSDTKSMLSRDEPKVVAITLHNNKKNTLRGIYRHIKKGVVAGKFEA